MYVQIKMSKLKYFAHLTLSILICTYIDTVEQFINNFPIFTFVLRPVIQIHTSIYFTYTYYLYIQRTDDLCLIQIQTIPNQD